VPELQRLRADHAPAVLTFELANRVYFAASISDRGDDFFDQFTERHSALLAEQEAGLGAFYVLVAEDGSVLGRFNLYFTEDGVANVGYRVAQHVAGRGVATATVRELCGLAAARYGLRTLKAATSHENAASQKVLARAGFIPVGPAGPADLGGKQGTWYQRDLVQPLSGVLLVRGYAVSRLCRVAVMRPGRGSAAGVGVRGSGRGRRRHRSSNNSGRGILAAVRPTAGAPVLHRRAITLPWLASSCSRSDDGSNGMTSADAFPTWGRSNRNLWITRQFCPWAVDNQPPGPGRVVYSAMYVSVVKLAVPGVSSPAVTYRHILGIYQAFGTAARRVPAFIPVPEGLLYPRRSSFPPGYTAHRVSCWGRNAMSGT
jgi:[ribosomal protein S5]-alanine N-acetyltransferase